MTFLQQGWKFLAALMVSLTAAIALAMLTPGQAIAASQFQLPNMPSLLAFGETALERRVEATTDQVTGKAQETFGDKAGSPANQAEGKARQIGGAARNRAEDIRDKVRDTSEAIQDEGETLTDRIKDFFTPDDTDTQGLSRSEQLKQSDAPNVAGTKRTGTY